MTEGGRNCIFARLNPMGIHREQSDKVNSGQKDNRFFLCARRVPLLTALPEGAKPSWTAQQPHGGSLAATMTMLLSPQRLSGCTLCSGSDFCCACDMETSVLSVFSPAVLLDVRQGAAVTRGAVHAQSDRAPRQRVPSPGQAGGLQAVPPGGLQRQDQRQHHHLTQAR